MSSVTDQAARNTRPESDKSLGEQVGDKAKETYESATGAVQPESGRSAAQKLGDTLKGTGTASGSSTSDVHGDNRGIDALGAGDTKQTESNI
ncbi:hypothetical protein JCM10213_007323 [Rhodosporidiobolus nylandii]